MIHKTKRKILGVSKIENHGILSKIVVVVVKRPRLSFS